MNEFFHISVDSSTVTFLKSVIVCSSLYVYKWIMSSFLKTCSAEYCIPNSHLGKKGTHSCIEYFVPHPTLY